MNLDFTGTDVVGALYLGGTQQANGLYDSSNPGGLITGTGRIQVGPFVSNAAWAAANAPGQGTALDHDRDGVANGVEYFMGKSGNDFIANPGIAADGTVTWPNSPAFSGSYAVQTSADLVEWTDVTEDVTQVTNNSDSIVWTRPVGPERRFVRLLVTPNWSKQARCGGTPQPRPAARRVSHDSCPWCGSRASQRSIPNEFLRTVVVQISNGSRSVGVRIQTAYCRNVWCRRDHRRR
ncbi:MAG: hypothetical protein NTW21_29905 [Verrucomicrobia bacterium]|nr:hypothetical protein [Verrucomicrobiota bacterium]